MNTNDPQEEPSLSRQLSPLGEEKVQLIRRVVGWSFGVIIFIVVLILLFSSSQVIYKGCHIKFCVIVYKGSPAEVGPIDTPSCILQKSLGPPVLAKAPWEYDIPFPRGVGERCDRGQ